MQLLSLDELRHLPAPFLCSEMQIEPQWIDYNGHLNMAYYNVIMDRSIDELFEVLGLGPHYLKTRQRSTMTAECHVRYLREVHLGDPLRVSILIVGSDEKRIHTFEQLHHATEGWLSATSENISLSIDMTARKVSPFPPDIAERVQAATAAHRSVPRPDAIGRQIALPQRK
jgi:acyl-CoA thioester hydrolase